MTASTQSIRNRLLFASFVLLPLFLALTFWVLDRAFASYQTDALQNQLRLQQLLLAKAADWDGKRWRFETLDEPRLTLENSGLYAFVMSEGGELLWHSPSALQMGEIDDPLGAVASMITTERLFAVPLGDQVFSECDTDQSYFCYVTGVAWGSEGPEARFLLLEHRLGMTQAREAYQGYLLALSAGLALLLLAAQAWVVRWGLSPLGNIAQDIHRLEVGELDELRPDVPRELQPLTDSVNQLLVSEQQRRERVRNTMDRLTHVLKTPLMVLRNSTEQGQIFRDLVQEQVTRMLGIVEGELARARLDGRAPVVLGQAVRVEAVLQRIVDAYARLPRVGSDAELIIDTGGVSRTALFRGEERDLQDLFGSILENSLKYCCERVSVSAVTDEDESGCWLRLSVADDGTGIPEGFEQEILRRGARADTARAGQGLGLAIVVEIVSAYGGSVHVHESDLGGAQFTVRLPAVDSAVAAPGA
ncbi:MAG: ATP-binding protein [Pseudomonadota bacterium]